MTYICKYGHHHRTERAVLFCHVNKPWEDKADQIKKTSWVYTGTTEVWSELGEFASFFWPSMRERIINRDKVCQYNGCSDNINLEVHHIIPRRLGGTDHPANLITLCHEHHRIQGAHHYDVGLVLNIQDIEKVRGMRIRQARPITETTLGSFIK
jgi:hypothetical protein